MAQLDKELEELKTLSSYATSLSCYIYLNITGMAKILKKFDKKFKRYNLDFSRNFIVEKYQKKNRIFNQKQYFTFILRTKIICSRKYKYRPKNTSRNSEKF